MEQGWFESDESWYRRIDKKSKHDELKRRELEAPVLCRIIEGSDIQECPICKVKPVYKCGDFSFPNGAWTYRYMLLCPACKRKIAVADIFKLIDTWNDAVKAYKLFNDNQPWYGYNTYN